MEDLISDNLKNFIVMEQFITCFKLYYTNWLSNFWATMYYCQAQTVIAVSCRIEYVCSKMN